MAPGEQVFETQAKVVRFYVFNKRMFHAKGCVAYLIGIDRRDAGGKYSNLFADRIPVRWAYLGSDALDIPGRTGLYCDVATSVDEANARLMPNADPVIPKLFPYLLREHATYRFTILVTARNAKPLTVRICIRWKGHWDIAADDVWQEG